MKMFGKLLSVSLIAICLVFNVAFSVSAATVYKDGTYKETGAVDPLGVDYTLEIIVNSGEITTATMTAVVSGVGLTSDTLAFLPADYQDEGQSVIDNTQAYCEGIISTQDGTQVTKATVDCGTYDCLQKLWGKFVAEAVDNSEVVAATDTATASSDTTTASTDIAPNPSTGDAGLTLYIILAVASGATLLGFVHKKLKINK